MYSVYLLLISVRFIKAENLDGRLFWPFRKRCLSKFSTSTNLGILAKLNQPYAQGYKRFLMKFCILIKWPIWHHPITGTTDQTSLFTDSPVRTELLLAQGTCIAYLNLKKSGRVKLSQLNRQSVQNQVTQHMSAKLSLVAGSWLFHDDDDDDVNLWQLGLFAKIGRCVSRLITIVKGQSVCNNNVTMSSLLASIKIFQLNSPLAWCVSNFGS